MKSILYTTFLILLIVSCTTDNTDVSVTQNVNPVQDSVFVDTVPPTLDSLLFNKVALNCFYHLGYSTGGEFYYKTAIESVHQTILEVIKNHGKNGSDIVLLIDKTGSMQNDIDSVRINLNSIIDQVEKLEDIRLAVAVYGDKNVDGENWWSSTDISSNYQISRDYINSLVVSDGGDYPESVYDGIAKTITESNWRKESKKMILVIGDAPSLEDSLTDHSRQDVLSLCNEKGIKVNLFPVLVTPYKAEMFIESSSYSEQLIDKIFPNPVRDKITIKFSKDDTYRIVLMDLTGKVIFEDKLSGSEVTIPISEDISNDTYVLRVLDDKLENMNAEKIIVNR